MKLATVILFAKDVARLRAFYGDLLGLSVIEDQPGWVRFDAGGCAVALHAIPAPIAAAITIEDPPVAREDTPIKLAFQVEDVALERERLIAGCARMGELKRFGAVALCDGVDPEGNVFQISSRPV